MRSIPCRTRKSDISRKIVVAFCHSLEITMRTVSKVAEQRHFYKLWNSTGVHIHTFLTTLREPPGSHPEVTRGPRGKKSETPREPPGNHLAAIREQLRNPSGNVRTSITKCTATTKEPRESHPGVDRESGLS